MGLPHTRGGVSLILWAIKNKTRSSPHTWGCFYGLQCKSGKRSVFPTHVGVFPALFYLLHPSLCLPHTRGGVSDRRAVCWTRNRSSPHAWGCFRHQRLVPAATTVFPTRVGVFLTIYTCSDAFHGLPHTRGGVSIVQSHNLTGLSSSPHAWGCFSCMVRILQSHHVFPTRVGVFLPPGVRARAITCLPPHAWGCFPAAGRRADGCRVFPTCVGVFLHHV